MLSVKREEKTFITDINLKLLLKINEENMFSEFLLIYSCKNFPFGENSGLYSTKLSVKVTSVGGTSLHRVLKLLFFRVTCIVSFAVSVVFSQQQSIFVRLGSVFFTTATARI